MTADRERGGDDHERGGDDREAHGDADRERAGDGPEQGGDGPADTASDGGGDHGDGDPTTAQTPATDGGDAARVGPAETATLAVDGDGVFASLPGGAATVGVAVVVATLGVLALPVGFDLPGFAFVVMEEATLFVLYAMVLLGLNLQFGDTGIINFGPVLFLGLGLYATALISADVPGFASGTGLDLFWGLGLAVGIVAAVGGGLVLGASSLRLREDYLAITTLAAAEILFEIVRVFRDPFGGNRGLVGIPQLVVETGTGGVLPLAETAALQDLATLTLFTGLLLVAYEGFRRLSASPYGRVLRSIQADEDATRGMGKSTYSYKLQVFAFGAVVAGLAGGLMGMFFGSADPALISIDVTVIIWIGMMIGGAGNHRGAITGLAIVMSFELFVRLTNSLVTQQLGLIDATQFNALRGGLIGLLLILVIRYRPEGLFGDPEKLEVFK
ncbi:branched-chain amino acid ABC transporter permease [Halobaculum sp. MBLA0147]|uniref:branched-chain amino acid ABC transporter permease n=1 Tax=Halobaculum sp. MBLA0147 TaxID=3079934 RepID=UPI0035250892